MDEMETQTSTTGIAIVGIACRFPGARNIEQFWQNLRDGVESISFFSEQELKSSGVSPAVLNNPNYVKAGAVLEGIELFDASFFGFTPREAEIMDPQHRLFLECAWEALENAGYDSETFERSIGVYAGASMNTYLLNNLYSNRDLIESVGSFQTTIGNDKDFLTTRVSYKLNLKGPSLTIQTACSTSLVAVHQACQSLLNYECDMALAGGVTVQSPQKKGYLYQDGMILSPDGHCRAFDARAQGTVVGNGVGIVVLKRLADALKDGDSIHAVIRGSAINNDGSLKVGYTAPGVEGQAEVIAMAQAVAGVEAETISYIEAHGTGTSLGDPIEIAALTEAFRASTSKNGFCAIGSVKTNIGHADAAAGVAGLIKTVQALKHGLLPPSLHFERPNPNIDFASGPFYVNTSLAEWKDCPTPRRAGVSAFGIGGTNAHVVLEEAPSAHSSGESRPSQLLLLSATTASALDKATANLAEHLKNDPGLNLADVAYTLQAGRKAFAHRRMLVCGELNDAVSALDTLDPGRVVTRYHERSNPPVVFMFPGQGSQYLNMGLELYQVEPTFRERVTFCAEFLKPHLGLDLCDVLYPREANTEEARWQLNQTVVTQAALFAIEYAAAKLWMEWGVRPQAMIGHSVGEYVAACVAGVFSLEDALTLIAERGRLMQRLSPGAMLAVRLSEKQVQPLLTDSLSLAAVNGGSLCVVSGKIEAVEALQDRLVEEGVACRRLDTSHAFHSEMMDPILGPFIDQVEKVSLNPPHTPYMSNVSGTWITMEEATDPGYWARHLRQTVRFAEGLEVLLNDSERILLEVGPGQTLSRLAKQHPKRIREQVVLSSLSHSHAQNLEETSLLNTLGRLWVQGVKVDWSGFYAHERRQRLPLPTYPFERKRYWIDPPKKDQSKDLQADMAHPGFTSTSASEQGNAFEKTEQERLIVHQSWRQDRILSTLKTLLNELSGVDVDEIDSSTTFLEMGFDSLFLTQATQAIQNQFGIRISFRNLLEECSTPDALAAYLDQKLPADELPIDAPATEAAPDGVEKTSARQSLVELSDVLSHVSAREGGTLQPPTAMERIMKQQLQVMAQQLDILRNHASTRESLPPLEVTESHDQVKLDKVSTDCTPITKSNAIAESARAETVQPEPKQFGPFKPIRKAATSGLSLHQQKHVDCLIARYTARTQASKRLTETYRASLADPRAGAGFDLLWKEMVYPIVVERSFGSKLRDVDGTEYVDLAMGFGVNLFGHSPAFVTSALEEQLKRGVEIGPQSPLAGRVAELICEFTGMQRVTFCNTGSEAVMAALRVARTVTARTKIALFSGSYHGTFDEVLVRANNVNGQLRSIPIAPGIPAHMASDVLVLEYGSAESLDILRAHARDLAAVLVEPVQSRQPDLQPGGFLRELRELTEESGTALIFDEVITGFRVHPRGAQGWFDVQADLATYGKVIGGGMPIGVLAGKAVYMDALDGGNWNYGDNSFPEAGVTFFAGTFVRHPLALAAASAVLNHLKANGPELQQQLNEKTSHFVETLNSYFLANQVPIRVLHFGSLFYLHFENEQKFNSLLYFHLRDKGVHIWEGRPGFLSTAHSDEDIEYLIRAFKESVSEMQEGGFLTGESSHLSKSAAQSDNSSKDIFLSLAQIDADSTSIHSSAKPAEGAEETLIAPLTEAQKEIWYATQMEDNASCAYNESCSIHIRGALNLVAIEKAIQNVVDRHDSLRATFHPNGEYQQFSPALTIDIPLVDLSSLDDNERETQVVALVAIEERQPFDLVNGPLLRAGIVKLEENYHLLILTIHHIVCDGWSFNVLLNELSTLYSSKCRNVSSRLATPARFSQYAYRAATQQQTPEMAETQTYWLEQFSDSVPVLELPTDRPRPHTRTYNGALETATIDERLYEDLKRLSARKSCTTFTVLLAAYTVLLQRLTGQEDLVVGVPAAGQALVGSHDLVGHCVNMLPLRIRINSPHSFTEHLASVKRLVLDAYDHQNYTFGSLVRKLNLRRDPSRVPLVAATFNIDRAIGKLDFLGLEVDVVTNAKRAISFDLKFNLTEEDSKFKLECYYNSDLFNAQTIQRWLRHFHTLLEAIVADQEHVVATLPLLAQAELNQLLMDWNDTRADYAQDRCFHELFEAQVERTPKATAVVFEHQRLTYQELNRRSNQLAHYLRRQGVGPESVVGICIERSVEIVVGLLAILKAGGAYVPLEPAWPKHRIMLMLEDAGAKVLLASNNIVKELPESGIRVISIDGDSQVIAREPNENTNRRVNQDNLAYVIYTSGSTGRPKGVAIEHRQVMNYVNGICQRLELQPGWSYAVVSTIAADLGNTAILPSLATGGCLHIISRDTATDAAAFADYFRRNKIDCLKITPSHLQALLTHEDPKLILPRKRLILGGEASSWDLVTSIRSLAPDCTIYNHYGPTETTVGVLTWRVDEETNRQRSTSVPLGRPLPNSRVYLLDVNLQPVPIGIPGELYIGGAGLARGYINHPEITAERFINHTFHGDLRERLYKTGDLASFLPDGNVEFLGRIDHQVKIRGFRVEPGEVGAVLGQHPLVRDALIVAKESEDGDKRLVAYVVTDQHNVPTKADLRHFLQARLPDYMIPSTFIRLESLPLTPTGKVDHRALPARDEDRPEMNEAFELPRTPGEVALAQIWAEVLRVGQVGVNDNFFELGGHSLLATQVITRVRQAFHVELRLRQFFEQPTLSGLALAIAQGQAERQEPEEISDMLAELEGISDEEALRLISADAAETSDRNQGNTSSSTLQIVS